MHEQNNRIPDENYFHSDNFTTLDESRQDSACHDEHDNLSEDEHSQDDNLQLINDTVERIEQIKRCRRKANTTLATQAERCSKDHLDKICLINM